MKRLLLAILLLSGCSETEVYQNEKYKFTCEKVESQKTFGAFAEVTRCENHELVCYNQAVVILLFPAITSSCVKKESE